MSLVTNTATRWPGRIISVGCTCRSFWTICWPCAVDVLRRTGSGELAERRIRGTQAAAVRLLSRGAEQRTQHDALRQPPPMVVDLVFDAGKSGQVSARHAFETQAAAVRKAQPGPHEQHALLPVGDAAVVLADQRRALRNQHVLAANRVVDGFGDLELS